MATNTYGRQVILALTNKSGGSVAAGDVVIQDTTNNEAFTTTTSAGFTGGVGIAQETIANNATGRVLLSGYAALVNVNASVTRGNFGKTHTVAKQATDAGASRTVGTFCQFLTGGTTPTARVYSPDLSSSSGAVATDAIWDAKGDLAAGTGADTASKLTVGSNVAILTADSTQSTGLAWWLLGSGRVDRTNIGSDLTIASTTWAYIDTTNLAITFTTRASRVVIGLSGRIANTSSGAFTRFGFDIDGTPIHTESAGSNSITGFRSNGVSVSDGIMVSHLTTVLSAGSHTFKPRWNCSTGTTTLFQSASTDHISFWAYELPVG